MANSDNDVLLAGLAELGAAEPPDSLIDRIVARWVRVPGPAGDLSVAFTDHGIAYVRPAEGEDFTRSFQAQFGRPLLAAGTPPPGLLPALRSGQGAGLRFDLRHLSAFQRAVLEATRAIPPGQVRPYSWVAREIGRPRAVRAVGSALGRNPVPVLLPCHRVTRSDATPGGYVFGTEMKEALLRNEDVDLGGLRELARSHVLYLGSATTGIVCFPTCHHARRVTAAHRQGFGSVAEARAGGYRPCRTCRPA